MAPLVFLHHVGGPHKIIGHILAKHSFSVFPQNALNSPVGIPVQLQHEKLHGILVDPLRVGEIACLESFRTIPVVFPVARTHQCPESSPGTIPIHADLGEADHGELPRNSVVQRVLGKRLEAIDQKQVKPVWLLLIHPLVECRPFVLDEAIEVPGGEHDPGCGEVLFRQFRHRLCRAHESIRAPGRAVRASASPLVVGPDPDVVETDAGKGAQHFAPVLQNQLKSSRFGGADFRVVETSGLAEVAVVRLVDRLHVLGSRGKALVPQHGQRRAHAHPIGCLEQAAQSCDHRHRIGIIHT